MNKKISITHNLTVQFYDLDPMNVVYHGNYVKYMEEARCNFFNTIGYTYNNMVEDGFVYPVAKLEIKYVKSAFLGQNLEIICTLQETEPALIFEYKMVDAETKELVCRAKTMQMGVDKETKESRLEISERFRRKIDEYKA